VRFQPGLLPPPPQEVALVYDFEGAGIEASSNCQRKRVIAYRVEEDKLRVVASPSKLAALLLLHGLLLKGLGCVICLASIVTIPFYVTNQWLPASLLL